MISREKFDSIVLEYYKQDKRIDTIGEFIPSYYDSPIVEYGWKMFDEVKQAYFTEEGVDWIDYYLYENPEKCYYQDEQRVPLETLDDLWKVIEPYRK